MINYIILHYKVIDETIKCVDSIKKIISDDSKIIIIDNFSNNGSGQELEKKYKKFENIDVIINEENLGFARGNNVAYKYAKNKYNPDFIVIMNNDIEIVNEDFENIIRKSYEEEDYYILSPDVYSTTYGVHQSPKRLKTYTKEEVKKLNTKFSRDKNPNLRVRLKSLIKSNKILRKLVYIQRNKNTNIDYSKKYYNVPLHGSFLVYSSKYINKESLAFSEGTFFYYETEILDYICNKKGYKTIYNPEIKVLHHQNASTNSVYKGMLDKTLFSNKNNFISTSHFLKIIESYEGK